MSYNNIPLVRDSVGNGLTLYDMWIDKSTIKPLWGNENEFFWNKFHKKFLNHKNIWLIITLLLHVKILMKGQYFVLLATGFDGEAANQEKHPVRQRLDIADNHKNQKNSLFYQ